MAGLALMAVAAVKSLAAGFALAMKPSRTRRAEWAIGFASPSKACIESVMLSALRQHQPSWTVFSGTVSE